MYSKLNDAHSRYTVLSEARGWAAEHCSQLAVHSYRLGLMIKRWPQWLSVRTVCPIGPESAQSNFYPIQPAWVRSNHSNSQIDQDHRGKKLSLDPDQEPLLPLPSGPSNALIR